MKILPVEKIREADAYTIAHEPVADIDLMERAATQICTWIQQHIPVGRPVKIFCGPGNNGGDGYAAGRMLAQHGYKVTICRVDIRSTMSESCLTNFERAKGMPEITIDTICPEEGLPPLSKDDLVVDALFGSGLSKPVTGFPGRVIDHINASGATVVAVDVPSGFFCDKTNTTNKGSIMHATYTLSFQFPKLGFMFPENGLYTGHWETLPIGLHPHFIDTFEADYYFVEERDVLPLLKMRGKFDHKGSFGHGLLISGSYGKIGAAVLGAGAAIRAGAGLITAHIPACGYQVLQTSVPEVMTSADEHNHMITGLPSLSAYNAIAVGPGVGMDDATTKALKLLIQNSSIPLILDADAINILAENKTWLSFIPKNSIFTPHPKEFERIAGSSKDQFERNRLQRAFSVKHGVYIVLKGAHTAITCPDGSCWFNSTGNPGMATGGSGDVLTGILLGLCAQRYSPSTACLLGVYLHGLAGDLAFEKTGFEALTAGDIVKHIGKAFKYLWDKKISATY